MINFTTSKVFGIHALPFMHGHIYPETMRGCGNFTQMMPTIVWLQLIELDQDLIMFDPRGLFFDKTQSKSGI